MNSGTQCLVQPSVCAVNFRTMATVLARTPRFGGHTDRGVYSVAQHSREGAYAVLRDTGRRDCAAAFLLHDGHEYIIGDIATPVVDALAAHAVLVSGDLNSADVVKRAVRSLKSTLDEAIHKAAGIPWPLPPDVRAIVKEYDLRVGRTERDARMAPPPQKWDPIWEAAEPVRGMMLEQISETCAAAMFLSACADLLTVNAFRD